MMTDDAVLMDVIVQVVDDDDLSVVGTAAAVDVSIAVLLVEVE